MWTPHCSGASVHKAHQQSTIGKENNIGNPSSQENLVMTWLCECPSSVQTPGVGGGGRGVSMSPAILGVLD